MTKNRKAPSLMKAIAVIATATALILLSQFDLSL